jgi:Fe2+ or Zn2+ uptake regulation protein/O6-methylguanine-DNA--protein-cysteine methyltransferase
MRRLTPEDASELLRARGMRSTPQRRAILSVFGGGRTEHLSADEIYARASEALSGLSRATVYATLAEFSELGLLSAFGSPEPVRYDTNLEPHAHFRCRLCLRISDLAGGRQVPGDINDPGFVVERVETRAEGVCDECTAYAAGLQAGASAMRKAGPAIDTLSASGVAVSELESPLGPLILGATPQGLTRLAFDDHGDVDALRAHAASRRGSHAARGHLAQASTSLQEYFSGQLSLPVCSIDWGRLDSGAPGLTATEAIPYGTQRSYSTLDRGLSSRDLGRLLGRNPIPVFMPCHRVGRGTETPVTFVGGAARRQWLQAHEQTHGPVA